MGPSPPPHARNSPLWTHQHADVRGRNGGDAGEGGAEVDTQGAY